MIFAQVIEGLVVNVVVADPLWADFQRNGFIQGYADANSSTRYNTPEVGSTYNLERDAFVSRQPYMSWSLNDASLKWSPPIPYPNDGESYRWVEETMQWKQLP